MRYYYSDKEQTGRGEQVRRHLVCLSDQINNLHSSMTWQSSTWDIRRKLRMEPHIRSHEKSQDALDMETKYTLSFWFSCQHLVVNSTITTPCRDVFSCAARSRLQGWRLRPCSDFALQQTAELFAHMQLTAAVTAGPPCMLIKCIYRYTMSCLSLLSHLFVWHRQSYLVVGHNPAQLRRVSAEELWL